MPIPSNMQLYNKVKKEIEEKYEKPSAYRSGAIIKEYKRRGGEYIDDGKEKKLKRWLKEDWKDVNPDKTDKSYPVYRPTKRVTKDTPLTVDEVDPKNLKKQAKLKQKIKGFANLPPFESNDTDDTKDRIEYLQSKQKLMASYGNAIRKKYPKSIRAKKNEKKENNVKVTPLSVKEEQEGYKKLVGGSVKEDIDNTVKEVKRVAKRKARNTVKDIEKVGEYFTNKRVAGLLPPSFRKLLATVGDEKITSLTVVRSPLENFVSSLLNVISLGAFDKAVQGAKYDKMFHLALFINNKYILDKQEVLKLVLGNPVKNNSEKMDIDLGGKEITINDLVMKTKERMGDQLFSNYNSRFNNCQDFVMNVLEANGLITESLKEFIKQNADEVFKRLPRITEKLANFLTDTGAVANKIIEGQGKPNRDKLVKLHTTGYGFRIKHGDDEIVIKVEKLKNENADDARNRKEKQKTSWKRFVSENLKGQKMGNLQNVNEKIKELSVQWKAMKENNHG